MIYCIVVKIHLSWKEGEKKVKEAQDEEERKKREEEAKSVKENEDEDGDEDDDDDDSTDAGDVEPGEVCTYKCAILKGICFKQFQQLFIE
jgi:hypothetical protein